MHWVGTSLENFIYETPVDLKIELSEKVLKFGSESQYTSLQTNEITFIVVGFNAFR
jgi:hypothetical protein